MFPLTGSRLRRIHSKDHMSLSAVVPRSDSVPLDAESYGFRVAYVGTHSSRTIMLTELRYLLAAVGAEGGYADYQRAVVQDNVLSKATLSTREKTWRHLRELYGLAPGIQLFRVMRDLWDEDAGGQPLLAGLLALARDPVLRCTLETVTSLGRGQELSSAALSDRVGEAYPGRYSSGVLARIGRNLASSWEQIGLLEGKAVKRRAQPASSMPATVYALLLGYLCGARNERLFTTAWASVLDAPVERLREQALAASRQGWMEYRTLGHMTEITFHHLLRDSPGERA